MATLNGEGRQRGLPVFESARPRLPKAESARLKNISVSPSAASLNVDLIQRCYSKLDQKSAAWFVLLAFQVFEMRMNIVCGCLPLRHGTQALAVVGIVVNAFIFIATILANFTGVEVVLTEEAYELLDEFGLKDNSTFDFIVDAILIGRATLMIGVNVVMMHGSINKKPKHMMLYLILVPIVAIVEILLLPILVYLTFRLPNLIPIYLFLAICVFYDIYCYVVVYFHYRQLKQEVEEDDQEQQDEEQGKRRVRPRQ